MEHESWSDLLEKLCVIVPVLGGFMFAVFRLLYKKWLSMVLTALQSQLNEGFVLLMKEVKPNGGNTHSLGDTIVKLVRTTNDLLATTNTQTTMLEEHTRVLGEITGVTNETKQHLDRKILHESRQGGGGGGLGGTQLVEEIEKELEGKGNYK